MYETTYGSVRYQRPREHYGFSHEPLYRPHGPHLRGRGTTAHLGPHLRLPVGERRPSIARSAGRRVNREQGQREHQRAAAGGDGCAGAGLPAGRPTRLLPGGARPLQPHRGGADAALAAVHPGGGRSAAHGPHPEWAGARPPAWLRERLRLYRGGDRRSARAVGTGLRRGPLQRQAGPEWRPAVTRQGVAGLALAGVCLTACVGTPRVSGVPGASPAPQTPWQPPAEAMRKLEAADTSTA